MDDLTSARWRTRSYSGGSNIQVGMAAPAIVVSDSKTPVASSAIHRQAWTAFTTQLKPYS